MNKALIITAIFLFSVLLPIAAQSNIEVSGWVKIEDQTLRNAEVRLFEGQLLIEKTKTNRWGHFSLLMEDNKEYMLVVSHNGEIGKRIVFRTNVPIEKQPSELYYEFIVDMELEKEKYSPNKHYLVSFDQVNQGFNYLHPIVSQNLIQLGENQNRNEKLEARKNH